MTTLANRLQRAYSLLVSGANSLQSLFLLFVRLYWGWQFVVDGWGKLHNLPKVIEYFGSLGLPMPGPNCVLRDRFWNWSAASCSRSDWAVVSSPCC